MAAEIADEYLSSLTDLTVNSKPLINMLTMLAEENSNFAPSIVQAIESHINKLLALKEFEQSKERVGFWNIVCLQVSPDVKLPILYLIDSIVKNVSAVYVPLFTNNIVQIFASVFEKVDEKTRMCMFKLRQTWNDIFPAKKMYTLDLRIQHIDQNWPIISPPPTSIHVNPKFLNKSVSSHDSAKAVAQSSATRLSSEHEATIMQKKQILQELQAKKRELELIQQKVLFGDQLPVRTVVNDESSKPRNVSIPKSTPKAVIIPPNSASANNQQPVLKTKIAPVNSMLIAAAKSRDPRLARMQSMKKNETVKNLDLEPKPRKLIKNNQVDNPVDDILRKQKSAALKSLSKKVEKEVPEVKITEELIQQRQMAMLKAPVLGQLNRKGSDVEKPRRRQYSPQRKVVRERRNSPKNIEKDSPNKSKGHRDSKIKRKHRDKLSRIESKSEENKPDRKRGKSDKRDDKEKDDMRVPEMIEPVFSPASSPLPSENGMSTANSFFNEERTIKIVSPEPPPPPSIGSQENTIEIMDVEEEDSSLQEREETVGFKNVKAVKSRNYSRRNKERSISPLPSIDSTPSDETNSIQVLKSTTEDTVDVGKDVDLRLLMIGNSKKRSSTDGNLDGPPNKRGKDGDTIQLFGNKDMDERLPPGGLRTPPPPLISTTPPLGSPNDQDSRTDSSIRDTKISDHDENDAEEVLNKEELDRILTRFGDAVDKTKILDEFIVTAKDQLNRGTITSTQYNQFMHQIVQTTENEKIKTAQKRRDSLLKNNEDGSYERLPRPNFPGGNFRPQGPWRQEEEGGPFGRRWRGRGGTGYGPRGRVGGEPHWRDRDNRFQQGGNSPDWMESDSRSQEAWMNMSDVSIPPTDPSLLTAISSDPVRHISIDGTPRAIRFYGKLAVVMLSFSSAREISFENGMRRVFIAGLEISCQFNGPPMPFLFQKNTHTVRLGAPTRELYIDDHYSEVQFGGPPVQAQLAGVPCTVQLDGPPPQVRIAPRGNHLCLGSVLLIVNARSSFPIYLDAKPQRFEINGRPLVFKFSKKLTLVLINDVPVPLQFGGSPVPIHFCDGQHFLRLTELPPGVTPGKVVITGMDENLENSPLHQDSNSNEAQTPLEQVNPSVPPTSELSRGVYTDLISSMMGGSGSEGENKVGFNYSIEPINETQPAPIAPTQGEIPSVAAPILQNLNINDLFKSLVATGIISNQPEPTPPTIKEDRSKLDTNLTPLKPITFDDTNSLKTKQSGAHSALYSGIQCGSCGIRFHPDDTQKYSQHLDWHFRQNRRGRDALRHGSCRRWYYDVKDWKEFNEIEELEDRAQSWFETEAQSLGADAMEEEIPPSEPAPRGGAPVMCNVCRDRFDTFFHEDTEEWHLKNCIAVNGKYYHPTCHQDAMEISETEPILGPPLLEPLKVEESKMEQSVVILELDDDDHDDGMDDIEVVTADEEDIRNVVNQLVERVVMEEECEASPIEDDELEVLTVTNTNITREPIAYIEIEDNSDDDDNEYDAAGNPILLFDPNKTIKLEPVDDMESPIAQVDQTLSNVVSTIDGNVALCEAPVAPTAAPSKIKITFTKPTATVPTPVPILDSVVEQIDPNELQIEEIVVEPLRIKPKKARIAERVIKEYPPCMKGSEMSGLCTIM